MYLGRLATIDSTQGNETAENADAILGSYFDAGNPAYNYTTQLTPGRLSEDANDTYDVDNGGGHDTFWVGGYELMFDAVAEYNITLTYIDGTQATITAYVFQDVNGETFLAPETSYNSDQAALTAQPIQSLSLNYVTRYEGDDRGDLQASRVDQDFAGPVDGTGGNDNMGVGYVDAQGDQITNNSDVINGGDGNDTIDGGGGSDSINGGAGFDSIFGGSGDDTIYGGTGADTIDGGIGNDSIRAGDEDDLIYGGDGNDTIYYGDGNDTVYGGSGNDVIDDVEGLHLAGNALIYAGDGNDTVYSARPLKPFTAMRATTGFMPKRVTTSSLAATGWMSCGAAKATTTSSATRATTI